MKQIPRSLLHITMPTQSNMYDNDFIFESCVPVPCRISMSSNSNLWRERKFKIDTKTEYLIRDTSRCGTLQKTQRLRPTLVNIFTHTHTGRTLDTIFSPKEKLMFYFVAKANNQKFNCQLHNYRVTGWCSNARNENSLYFLLSLFFKLFLFISTKRNDWTKVKYFFVFIKRIFIFMSQFKTIDMVLFSVY